MTITKHLLKHSEDYLVDPSYYLLKRERKRCCYLFVNSVGHAMKHLQGDFRHHNSKVCGKYRRWRRKSFIMPSGYDTLVTENIDSKIQSYATVITWDGKKFYK